VSLSATGGSVKVGTDTFFESSNTTPARPGVDHPAAGEEARGLDLGEVERPVAEQVHGDAAAGAEEE